MSTHATASQGPAHGSTQNATTPQASPTGAAEAPQADRDTRARRDTQARRARSGRSGRRGRRSQRPTGWPGFSAEQCEQRRASVPVISYPDLPVSARHDDIAHAISENQVVIIAGETGSGKTTQIPKICLELGRGVTGMIGHTQPRRIAARSVAERIADELGTRVSAESIVGYQVRFTDEASEHTLIKLMTDGILLAEIQSDPLLRRYDTIIVDEAHERSLNIDFILGYLARILPQRPDLKVIITSATIDSESFAEHFAHDGHPAPIIEVSGRTYPVEIRYRPLSLDAVEDEADGTAAPEELLEDRDQVTGILDAVDELMAEGPGDILVFLAGERDIRDTEQALLDHLPQGRAEILPLFSRLSAAEQHRIFQPHSQRRIVLATNVAETSLTVPGIRYVIDPGLARISRFSHRTKVQRLPIEPVSQASANQRSGRCGRVADGIAIRLYSQRDYDSRPTYTDPEILRTSLAAVILQMAALGLGSVENFPFIQPPDPRQIRDGVALLTEIGAISPASARELHEHGPQLTQIGRRLARLPIDPRLGRMLLEAGELGCVSEVMVIVAALSMQDVRERPADQQDAADAMHRRFADQSSDFLTYLNLWRYVRTQQRELSGSAFRRMCRSEFLHYLRIREWQDVYNQLRQLARSVGLSAAPVDLPSTAAIRRAGAELTPGTHEAGLSNADVAAAVMTLGRSADTPDADAIHRSLLVGLLSSLGQWDERRREYAGARGTRFVIWPGSGLRKKTYDWVMAAELVETSMLFARTVAKVEPRWVEQAASRAGLLKHVYGEPYWSARHGNAMVHEKILLYGMTLAADRPATLVSMGTPESSALARDMFIRHALVEGQWRSRHRFLAHNRALLEQLSEVEDRRRTRGLLADDDVLVTFYDDRLPESVTSGARFDHWWSRTRRKQPELLHFTRDILLPGGDNTAGFPDQWEQGDLTLGLTYTFQPGSPQDGVTLVIPIEVLGRVAEHGCDWLVPGMREELCVATIRALPKRVRRQLVPAPDVGRDIHRWLNDTYPTPEGASAPELSFREAFSQAVARLRDVEITEADWAQVTDSLPDHLRMNFAALDTDGSTLMSSRDLTHLRQTLRSRTHTAVRSAVAEAFERAQSATGRGRSRTGRAARSGQASHGEQTRQETHSRDGGQPSSPTSTGGGTAARQAGPAQSRQAGRVTELTNLHDWPDMDVIPAQVETRGRAASVVRGYPCLRATAPTRANLQIMPDELSQRMEHPAGVTALALARTILPTGRITSRWTARQSLTLAASPYPSTDSLVADMQQAAARIVARRWQGTIGTPLWEVRERSAFTALVSTMREQLEDETAQVAQWAADTLEAHRELERAVAASTSLTLLGVIQDVRDHAAQLVQSGFITQTPAQSLPHLARYLRADQARIEKAAASPQGPHQDAALAYQVEQAAQAVEAAHQRVQARPPSVETWEAEEQVERARWLLHELRVSLFAQTLGTAQKVSVTRITKLCAAI